MKQVLLRIPHTLRYLISGVLMGSAFLDPFLWWVIFPGLLLLLWCLTREQSAKRAFFFGWISGTTKMLLVLFFVWSVYPLTWLGISSTVIQLGLVFGLWVFVSIVTGAGYGFLGYFLLTLRQKMPPSGYLYTFPGLLLISEAGGSILYSLSVLGSGTGVSAMPSFGHSGYALVDHSIFKWAAQIGGVYVLTLLVGAIVVALFFAFKKWHTYQAYKKGAAIVAGILVVFFGFFSFAHAPEQKQTGREIAVVTTFFDSDTLYAEEEHVQRTKRTLVLDAVEEALKFDVAAVVLPESTRLSELYREDSDVLKMLARKGSEGTLLVDSVRVSQNGRDVSRAKVYDANVNTVYEFDKKYLVALGEYIPYVFSPLISLSNTSDRTDRILETISFARGNEQSEIELPGHVPNVLFCYEGHSPWRVWSLTKDRDDPGYVAYTASHAWFKGPQKRFLWRQAEDMLKAQALWSGIDIVQASNMAPSAHYKPDGTMGTLRSLYQNSHVRVDIVEID